MGSLDNIDMDSGTQDSEKTDQHSMTVLYGFYGSSSLSRLASNTAAVCVTWYVFISTHSAIAVGIVPLPNRLPLRQGLCLPEPWLTGSTEHPSSFFYAPGGNFSGPACLVCCLLRLQPVLAHCSCVRLVHRHGAVQIILKLNSPGHC